MVQGSLAHKLRVLRAERGLTLREAASLIGVAKETISDIERGLRHPHDPTLAKIAKGYGVPVEELLEEPALAGKAEAPEEAGRARTHGLSAEHQATPGWRRAFDNSRRFLFSQAKTRLREQLSLWETARNKGASSAERREFLDAMGRILDEASNVSNELMENLGEGLDGMSESGPSPYWTECQKADTLYRELFGMIGEAGLSVRAKKTEQAPGQWRYELLEVA
jgi:transcriptional regulator with XRE-family HTH domain